MSKHSFWVIVDAKNRLLNKDEAPTYVKRSNAKADLEFFKEYGQKNIRIVKATLVIHA